MTATGSPAPPAARQAAPAASESSPKFADEKDLRANLKGSAKNPDLAALACPRRGCGHLLGDHWQNHKKQFICMSFDCRCKV